MLKISQNNDNRGRHLEFYSHTGIGNWFQCFPVYPGLNLSSGSVSVSASGSGFRLPAFPYAPCDNFANVSHVVTAAFLDHDKVQKTDLKPLQLVKSE